MPPGPPTLRRKLTGALAIGLAGVLLVFSSALFIIVRTLPPVTVVIAVLVLVPVLVWGFRRFANSMLQAHLFTPLEVLSAATQEVSRGGAGLTQATAETVELQRIEGAVNELAARLLSEQQALADNIRSLDETNRLLTEARDAMIRTEKMASVGRLGAGIAHEVGNPLGAVMGYLALISRQVDGPLKEYASAAEKEAQRIDRIVRGLLDFARPREASAQAVDINAVVQDTIDLVKTQGRFNSVTLEFEQLDWPLIVRGDPYQLQQVLVNLLVNAADAVEDTPRSRVAVTAHRRAVLPLPVHTPARRRDDPEGIDYSHRRRLAVHPRWPMGDPETETGEVVEIVVADNGPGLPANMIDQVFEPFVTTKEPGKGTGLGLAVCARLIEGMGGVIRAGNATEGGAVFRVILPAIPAEVATP